MIPSRVEAVPSRDRMIDHYLYEVNGQKVKLDYEEVIQFRSMNPNSLIYGQGDLSATKMSVTTDIFAQVWNKAFFGNSASPVGLLQTDQTLPDNVRKRVIESWKTMFRGPKQHGKNAILESGLKFSKVSESAKDMDFVNLRKELRLEILAAFGVPPSIAGLLEFANYSNMKEQTRTFWTNTMIPLIRNVEQTLTFRAEQLTFESNRVFQADLSVVEALREDEKYKAETAQMYVNLGIPVNDVIDALDLPFEHIEGGDMPSPSIAPIGLAGKLETKKIDKKESDPDQERENKRYVEWKQFDDLMNQKENRFESSMRSYFGSQKRRILKKYRDNISRIIISGKANVGIIDKAKNRFFGTPIQIERKQIEDTVNLIFDLENEVNLMAKKSERLIRGVYADFAIRMGRRIDPTFDFNLQDPIAQAFINSKTLNLSTQANQFTLESLTDATVEEVQDAIALGLSESETIEQISGRINDIYDFAQKGRARRIARTEVLSASNAGSQDAMEKTGVVTKQWLSSRDSLVRDTHFGLDGQEVGIQEPFQSPGGSLLKFPGDPAAPPGEIINCRCTSIPTKTI